MNQHLERGILLLEHDRYQDALKEFHAAAGAEPEDGMTHAWMSMVYAGLKRHGDALQAAKQSVHLEPDNSFCHYSLALAHYQLDKLKDAHLAVIEAIRIDPYIANFYALQSELYLQQSKWQLALEAAQRGLASEPDHATCTNLRAMALRQLGETDDAAETLKSALREEPSNPITHANVGWNLLHQHKYKEALVSFREALRLDPELEMARAGIVEALKARNPVYAIILRFFIWMGRLSPAVHLGLVIGAVVGLNVLRRVSANVPMLAPWYNPIAMAYLLFVFATWMADPFFNLLLFTNPYGRYALSKRQKTTAAILGGALLICTGITGWLLVVTRLTNSSLEPWLLVIPYLITFPLLTACNADTVKARTLLGLYTLLMFGLLLLFAFLGMPTITYFTWGCVLSTWFGSVRSIVR